MLKKLKSQKYYIVGLLSTAVAILVVQTTARAVDLSVDNGQNISKVELIGYYFGSRKTKFNSTEREVDLSSSALRIGMSRKF